jgi:hypothetical protein
VGLILKDKKAHHDIHRMQLVEKKKRKQLDKWQEKRIKNHIRKDVLFLYISPPST